MNQFQEADDRFKSGMDAKHHKHLAKASEHFQAAIALNPNHAGAYGELGAIAYFHGNFEDAARLLQQAIELDADLGNAHLFLALTLGEQGDHDAAESRFQKAILTSDQPAVTYAAYGTYLGEQKRPEAEQAFSSALERDPQCVMALRDYARLLASYDRDDEAEVLFKRALHTDPNSAATNFRFGSFLSCFDHRGPEAVSYLRRALVLDPTLTAAQEVLDDMAP
jgi:tetratricopeptide (TPR) repeat protein